MYNCSGSVRLDDPHGSTKLHMDITDAVNIMVWANNCPDGKPGYALWHIWSAADAAILRRFFLEEGFGGLGDLIHGQSIYVNEAMRERLLTRYNVRPHAIHQRPGDAVFIPAGCAHQVRH